MSENILWHPGEISYDKRYAIMGQKGLVIWFTGLSGSGKSTLAVEVEKSITSMGKAVYRLDGDNLRHGLNSDLGFSEGDRNENIRRTAEVAALFKDAGLIVLVSQISPYRKMREFARQCIGNDAFIEVYVKADIETCIKRDPKGLYKKALAGEIKNFTGIDSVYEEPKNPDILVNTEQVGVKRCISIIIDIVTRFL